MRLPWTSVSDASAALTFVEPQFIPLLPIPSYTNPHTVSLDIPRTDHTDAPTRHRMVEEEVKRM